MRRVDPVNPVAIVKWSGAAKKFPVIGFTTLILCLGDVRAIFRFYD